MKKVCSKCKINKSLDEYYKQAKRKDGKRSACKNCINAYHVENKQRILENKKVYYTKNKQRRQEYNKRYYVENKQEMLEYQKKYRNRNKQKISEYRIENRPQILKGKKKYYAKNKQKIADYQKKYRETENGKLAIIKGHHTRRAKEKETPKDFTNKEYNFILHDCQGNRCACCGRIFTKELKHTLDHILPVSKGGPLIKENIQFLCKKHNSEKSIKYIDYRTDYHKEIIETI